MIGSYLDRVRTACPLVHNITNYVTVNDVANVILAVGASPLMADAPEEAAHMASIASALNINMGTVNSRTFEAMLLAGRRANDISKPVVFDPVGAGASPFRNACASKLLDEVRFDVIKGNASEINFLYTGAFGTRGVDVSDADKASDISVLAATARNLANNEGCIVAVTGAVDVVSDGRKTFAVSNGRAEMEKITGTGCQLSGMVAAFVAANPADKLGATLAAVCAMGVAGEIGFEKLNSDEGNSTYRNRIIDALNLMTAGTLNARAKYREI